MTNTENRLKSIRESLSLARKSLEHYMGTICEDDYRAMVARYENRVAVLERAAR